MFQSAAGTLNVADTARVYARRAAFGEAATVDVENTPRAAIGLGWPTTSFDLQYAPRFLWIDVAGANPSPTLLLHTAALALALRQPRTTLVLSQTAAYGEQNFTRVAGTTASVAPASSPGAAPAIPGMDAAAPPALDLVPRDAVIDYAGAESSASLRHELSRRWAGALRGAFEIAGGADAFAQQLLPRQRTAQLDAAIDFRASLSDELSTGLSVAQIGVSSGFDHWLLSLSERWSTRWSADTGGELGAGAALQDTTGPAGLRSTDWVPVATVSVWHAVLRRGAQLRLQWNAGYEPDVNALVGTLQSRLSTTVQAGLVIDRSTVRLALGAAQTFPRDAPDATQVVSADLAFEHALLDWLDLQTGAQLLHQSFASRTILASSGTLWSLYGGLEGRVPEVRF